MTSTVNSGRRLVDLMNKRIHVVEVEGDGECLLYVVARDVDTGNEISPEFVTDLMGYVNSIIPAGWSCYCGQDKGFWLVNGNE